MVIQKEITDMFANKLSIMAVSALFFFSVVFAQEDMDQDRMQARDSVQLHLSQDPDDAGLRHAQRCLESGNACDNVQTMQNAIERVRYHHGKHPGDAGLEHALRLLEHHQERNHAVASLRQNLEQDPDNPGLRHALRCVENGANCADGRALDHAMQTVREQYKKHPLDRGLEDALHHLERNQSRLHKPSKPQRPGKPEKPQRQHDSGHSKGHS